MNYIKDLYPMPYTLRDIQDLQARGIGIMNELNMFVKSYFCEMEVSCMAIKDFQEMIDALFDAYDQLYDLLFWNLPVEELEKFYNRVIN